MKPRKPVRRRSPRRRLVEEADHLIRAIVFDRDGYKCVRCGGHKCIAPSHVFPKGRYQNLRWLEINILTLCLGCHLQWWHLNPVEAAEWFQKTFPEAYKALMMLKDTMRKPDLKDLILELKSRQPTEVGVSQYMEIPKDSEIPF